MKNSKFSGVARLAQSNKGEKAPTLKMKVTCNETGEAWDSVEAAAQALGVTQAHVSKSIIRDKPINGKTFKKEEVK